MIINTVKFTNTTKVMAAVLNGVVINPIKPDQGIDCGTYQVEARLS